MNKANAEKMAETIRQCLPEASVNVEEQNLYFDDKTTHYVEVYTSVLGGRQRIYSTDELDDLKSQFPAFDATSKLAEAVRKLADKLVSGGYSDVEVATASVTAILKAANEAKMTYCGGCDRKVPCENRRYTDQEFCDECRTLVEVHRNKSTGRKCVSCEKYFYRYASGEGEAPSEDNLPKQCLKCEENGVEFPEEYRTMCNPVEEEEEEEVTPAEAVEALNNAFAKPR